MNINKVTTKEMFVEFVESSLVVCHNILQYGLRKTVAKVWYLNKVSGFIILSVERICY